jgi:hypothetical protein
MGVRAAVALLALATQVLAWPPNDQSVLDSSMSSLLQVKAKQDFLTKLGELEEDLKPISEASKFALPTRNVGELDSVMAKYMTPGADVFETIAGNNQLVAHVFGMCTAYVMPTSILDSVKGGVKQWIKQKLRFFVMGPLRLLWLGVRLVVYSARHKWNTVRGNEISPSLRESHHRALVEGRQVLTDVKNIFKAVVRHPSQAVTKALNVVYSVALRLAGFGTIFDIVNFGASLVDFVGSILAGLSNSRGDLISSCASCYINAPLPIADALNALSQESGLCSVGGVSVSEKLSRKLAKHQFPGQNIIRTVLDAALSPFNLLILAAPGQREAALRLELPRTLGARAIGRSVQFWRGLAESPATAAKRCTSACKRTNSEFVQDIMAHAGKETALLPGIAEEDHPGINCDRGNANWLQLNDKANWQTLFDGGSLPYSPPNGVRPRAVAVSLGDDDEEDDETEMSDSETDEDDDIGAEDDEVDLEAPPRRPRGSAHRRPPTWHRQVLSADDSDEEDVSSEIF